MPKKKQPNLEESASGAAGSSSDVPSPKDLSFNNFKGEKTYSFIDLFAGIGGMRIAFQSAGGYCEGEENFVGDSEIIALGGASNETKDRPLG